jgi:hypothetical protein
VYALDPSARNSVGNMMTVSVLWERELKLSPVGGRIAVVDYDAANQCCYPPVDLDDCRVLARGCQSACNPDDFRRAIRLLPKPLLMAS